MVRCLVSLAILFVLLLVSCSDSARPAGAAAAPSFNLPAPSALLKQLPKRKPASTEADVARTGAQFEPGLLNQHASISGANVEFAPQFNPPQSGAFSDLACAVYRFNLSGYDRDNTLRLAWGTPNSAAQAWIGLADMTHDRWEWHACPFGNVLDFTDPALYTAPTGDALVVIAMTGSGSFELDSLRFGLPQPVHHELWFYLGTNLLVSQNVTDAEALVDRAAAAGYTGCVLADSKLDKLDVMGDPYWANLSAFEAHCKSKGVTLIPALCGLGWAEGILSHDPNLIEGMPFNDVQFQVGSGSADSVQDATLANSGFENHTGDAFSGWTQVDGAGLSSFADTGVFHSGGCSMRLSNFASGQYGNNDRVRQVLDVKPWHRYVLSCWIKSSGLSPAGSVNFLVDTTDFSRGLTYDGITVQPTQDWQQYYISFNSQDQTQATLQVGIWGGVSGSFWVDDMQLVNAGLVNLIRRSGAPFSVKSADGSVTYSEGSDYDYASDPALGQDPWAGAYDIYHTPRPLLTIPAGSPIHNGDTLLVSGYHAVQTDEGKTACCLSEQGIYDIIAANFAKLKELVDPQEVMVGIDEQRVANWCAGCQALGFDSAGLLNYATNRIDGLAKSTLPGCRVVTWNDMYDPDHNAVPSYYLCRGSMVNSYADNPPADWDVANWRFFDYNGHTPDTSIAFFSGRGNRQILAGYYDRGDSGDIAPWLDYSKGYSGVFACMYTTWGNDYSQLENWAQAVKDWDTANQ